MDRYKVAIVGANGRYGKDLALLMESVDFPVEYVFALDKKEFEGKKISYGYEGGFLTLKYFKGFNFNKVQFVFFLPNSDDEFYDLYIDVLHNYKCFIIDASNFNVLKNNHDLIIPSINGSKITRDKRVFVSPCSSVFQICMSMKLIMSKFSLNNLVVSGYQSVSELGENAMNELFNQTKSKYTNEEFIGFVFQEQIAFNCIPSIGSIDKNGNSLGEEIIYRGVKNIFDEKDFLFSITCVRVPIFVGSCFSIYFELNENVSLDKLKNYFNDIEGVIFIEDGYKTPIACVKNEYVFISRLRCSDFKKSSKKFLMWVSCDNIFAGVVLNIFNIFQNLIFILRTE